METKIRKLILSILIVYRNEIGNVLDVIDYVLFISGIDRKMSQYFLQVWYLRIINYIRHFYSPQTSFIRFSIFSVNLCAPVCEEQRPSIAPDEEKPCKTRRTGARR